MSRNASFANYYEVPIEKVDDHVGTRHSFFKDQQINVNSFHKYGTKETTDCLEVLVLAQMELLKRYNIKNFHLSVLCGIQRGKNYFLILIFNYLESTFCNERKILGYTFMKTIILAAGRGSRMGNLTDEKPKCLLEVFGKPLIEHQIEALTKGGIEDIAIVTGYKVNF